MIKDEKQKKMETEIQRDIENMYPKNPEHLYCRMGLEFHSCSAADRSRTLRYPVQECELNHMSTMH